MLHTIENKYLRVTASEQGAELQSILGCDATEYLWQGDPTYWGDRAINIFPYVARLTEGRYFLDGKCYEMKIHGFAHHFRFSLAERSDRHMVLELAANPDTLAQYPRQFVFRVIYALHEDTLEITYEVENQDEKTMYFSMGGHPGFNVPYGGGSFEDYRLRFGEACTPQRVVFSDSTLVQGFKDYPLEEETLLPLRHTLFDQGAIVLKGMSRQVTLEAPNASRSITVSYPDMPYLGLWHAVKTDAPYVCIEPWSSLPSSEGKITVFEEKEDLIRLEPEMTYRNKWTITIR